MKFNLKNRPKKPEVEFKKGWQHVAEVLGDHYVETKKWFEGFEKEIREIKKIVDAYKFDKKFMEGRSQTIKEILGES